MDLIKCLYEQIISCEECEECEEHWSQGGGCNGYC